MKITSSKIEISPQQSIAWEDVQILRLLNDTLVAELKNGKKVTLGHLHPFQIDRAFKSYEQYLREHPEKKSA